MSITFSVMTVLQDDGSAKDRMRTGQLKISDSIREKCLQSHKAPRSMKTMILTSRGPTCVAWCCPVTIQIRPLLSHHTKLPLQQTHPSLVWQGIIGLAMAAFTVQSVCPSHVDHTLSVSVGHTACFAMCLLYWSERGAGGCTVNLLRAYGSSSTLDNQSIHWYWLLTTRTLDAHLASVAGTPLRTDLVVSRINRQSFSGILPITREPWLTHKSVRPAIQYLNTDDLVNMYSGAHLRVCSNSTSPNASIWLTVNRARPWLSGGSQYIIVP